MDSSNIDSVMAGIESWLAEFNFQRPGRDQSLGRDIVMCVIRGPDIGAMGGISGRVADAKTPEGVDWPAGSKEYAKEKKRRYGWSEVNRRTGSMVSQERLYGRTRIEPDTITMVYGLDTPPSRSVSPNGFMSKQDSETSDVSKAMHAHAQGRAFYGFNEEDRVNVIELAQENLNDHISEHNQGQ